MIKVHPTRGNVLLADLVILQKGDFTLLNEHRPKENAEIYREFFYD